MAKQTEARLFTYAIILQGKVNRDGETTEEPKLIVEPTTVLCADSEQATLLAGRAIPEEHIGQLDRITLAVAPF